MKRLSAIIAGFPCENAARVFERVLLSLPIEWCLAICKYEEHLPRLPAGRHGLKDADVRWFYPGILDDTDWNTIRPLDGALVSGMRETEVVFLKMLTRRETKGRTLTYLERKREYLRTLRYWNHVLGERSIDFFLACDIPHTGPEYVLEALCKRRGIPTFFFHPQPLKGMLFLEADREPSAEIRDRYEELKRKTEGKNASDIALGEIADRYYRMHALGEEDPTPWYMRTRQPNPLRLWLGTIRKTLRRSPAMFSRRACSTIARLWTPASCRRTVSRLREYRRGRALFRFYDAHAIEPDLSRLFVYVPLHYQPECSTCPMGGAFVEQLLLVQLLAFCLPKDVHICVKEHPKQKALGRDICFYEDLLRIPGVRLVPRSFDTFRLIEACAMVATVTGMAGFEGLFRGKPALVFGRVCYRHAPGVFPVRTAEDCRRAVTEVFSKLVRPKVQDMRLFLKAMEDVAIRGYLDPADRMLSDEENIASILPRLSLGKWFHAEVA